MCLPQLLQQHEKDADSVIIILEINTTLNVAENLGKIGKSKQKILVIEKEDVYGARFVNLQIFTFLHVEKKPPSGILRHVLTKNKTQTAVMNMTDERIVRKN